MQSQPLDQAFHALADPTRRAVVAHLTQGPKSVSDLARPFPMALPSFMQHLAVLEDCGLVRSRKTGRVRMVELNGPVLAEVESWLGVQRRMWEARLDRMDAFVLELKESGNADQDQS